MTQDAPSAVTTRGLGALLCVPGLPDVVLPALLRYSAGDPFAVRLVLLLGDEGSGPESVEWLFARATLTEGLTGGLTDGPGDGLTEQLPAPAAGDVQVRVDGHEVSLGLAGSAAVVLPLAGLVEFLADSYQVVPTGAETLIGAAVDDETARLLG